MKILLTAYVFFLNPETHKLELLWSEVIPQESVEQCKETGKRYKHLIEGVDNLEVQYFCNDRKITA